MREKVNSERIVSAANRIRSTNRTLNNEFSSVKRAGVSMSRNWNSPAQRYAESKLRSIASINEARSSVFSDYANVLSNVVAVNHDSSERENKKLASMFR